MFINECISKLMKEQKFTQQRMADSLGKKRASEIASRLMSKNMTFDRAIEMLAVLGYEVVVQPRKPGVRPAGQIVIEKSDKEKGEK